MLDTPPYMICVDLDARRAVVVGAGDMALEKIEGLLAAAARVTVVAPEPDDALATLADAGRIELRRKAFEPSDLDGALLVMAATDPDVNQQVFDAATARAMLVNVADVPELCNFILPAVAREGPVALAVTTSGASPALAKRMRHEAAAVFDRAYGRLAELLDAERPWAKAELPGYDARRDFFDAIVGGDPDPIALLRAGKEDDVVALIADAKRRALAAR